MAFAPKAGCPMCGIVAVAGTGTNNTSPSSAARPEILWRDANFTAYRETTNPVSSKSHIIIAFNLHVPSLYTLSSSDLPLLDKIRNLARRLLAASANPPSINNPTEGISQLDASQLHIGFITPPFSDIKIPVTDHLHAHAYIAPADQLGWLRSIAYGRLAWYEIDDLIAEIRESASNNRVKSGYENRKYAPINSVPEAGARTGAANGHEFTLPTVTVTDIEHGANWK